MSKLNLKITSSDRVFVAGKTGSGKTTLVKYFLLPIKRLIVIDMKNGLQDWGLDEFSSSTMRSIKNHDDYKVRITNKEQAFEAMNQLYQYGNGTLYIDEVVALIPEQSKAPEIVTHIWQRGRFLKIGAWSSSQRPKSIPITFLSEAEHFFIFRLNVEADRKRIYEITGEKRVLTPTKDQYGFYYYDLVNGQLKYFNQLNT